MSLACRLGALILFLFSLGATAQEEKAFFRLTIVNEQGELLVVKIKGSGVWVTTGLYEVPEKFSYDQFHNMASAYGLTIKDVTLHGDFQLSAGKGKPFQTRYFYQAMASGEVQKVPDFIEEVKWMKPDLAYDRLTFPHISYLTKQTLNHPQQVWSAKVQRYMQDGKHKLQIIEGFHVGPGAISATPTSN